MNYWLMKTEPTTFGIEHLKKTPNQTTFWDGVRNYQARNMLRDQMKKGDLAFFYHSNCSDLGVVAIIEVVSNGEIDPTQFNSTSPYYDIKSFPDKPRWYGVKVKLKKVLPDVITLKQLKMNPQLKSMIILRPGNRLSVTPVSAKEWQAVLKMV